MAFVNAVVNAIVMLRFSISESLLVWLKQFHAYAAPASARTGLVLSLFFYVAFLSIF